MSHPHHHPHHTPKKSLPSDFPPSNLQDKVIVLAKVNLGITVIPLMSITLFLLLYYFRSDLLQEYARQHNETFIGGSLLSFGSLEKNKQWQNLLIQFGWAIGEAILAFTLLHGAKKRDYGYMKAWLLLMTGSFLFEIVVQGMMLTGPGNISQIPPLLLAVFVITDVYRFSCLFIVYLLIDEMLERGEVKRGRGSNYELEE